MNFRLDIPIQLDVRRYSETLCDRGMKQLVNVATDSKGHSLDVVIVRDNIFIVPALPNVYDPCLCDTYGNSSGDHSGDCNHVGIFVITYLHYGSFLCEWPASTVVNFMQESHICL